MVNVLPRLHPICSVLGKLLVIFIYIYCWLFSLLDTRWVRIWVPFFCHIFSREVSCLSTLAQALSPIPTYVVKAWKMNSDVIYHKEPGWCSVSICELLAKVAKILTGVPAEVSRRAMTFKTCTGWPNVEILLFWGLFPRWWCGDSVSNSIYRQRSVVVPSVLGAK